MTRLLIVEADHLVASLMNDWLCEVGHEVVGIAGTSTEVQNLLGLHSAIDGALLDISPPDSQSEDVAAVLTARSIPFLLLSALAPPGYASRRVLAKPPKVADFRQSVLQMLNESMV